MDDLFEKPEAEKKKRRRSRIARPGYAPGENPYFITGPAVISFSGGRTSGYLLKQILDAHGGELPPDVVVTFANTGREMPETLDFVHECSSRWEVPVVWLEFDPTAPHRTKVVNHNSAARNGEPFAAANIDRTYLPNPVTRFCTIELKIRRFSSYAQHHLGWPSWISVVGLRYDEDHRVVKQTRREALNKARWRSIFPLHTAGVTKADVGAFWKAQPFDLRLMSVRNTTPEGNCDLCYLKSQGTLQGIMRRHPGVAAWWIAQEQQFPSTQRPGDTCYFRADRPSYAKMAAAVAAQPDIEDVIDDDDGSVDCSCTD